MMDAIRKLREKTSAGMMDCKKAIKEAAGNLEKAIEILRKKGVKLASERSSRAAKQGKVESYIHMNGKIGVLLELNCETDFVARNEEFQQFAKDIAMQIAAANPKYVKREEVPEDILNKEREILLEPIKNKPKEMQEKILVGKIESFYGEKCLLDQVFVKDPKTKIKDILHSLVAKIGENIVIRRFARFQLGEDI